jgi:hypothetical protein
VITELFVWVRSTSILALRGCFGVEMGKEISSVKISAETKYFSTCSSQLDENGRISKLILWIIYTFKSFLYPYILYAIFFYFISTSTSLEVCE